jgi:hypothetical protein
MSKSPSALVKEHFGDKSKLVAALGPLTNEDLWTPRVNEAKGLARVSNAKLLRLYKVLSAVKEKFGTRLKLVDAICEIDKRTKDEGYKKRLLEYPVPRLYDLYRSSAKRAGVAIETGSLETRLPKASPSEESAPAKAPKPAAAKSDVKAAAAKSPAKKSAAKPAAEKSKAAPKKGKG